MTAAAGLTSRSPAPVPRLSGAAPQALNPDGLLAEMPAPPPSRTPRLLRRLQVGAGLALLLLGTAACWVVTLLSTDLAGVPGLADQYARLGDVHSALVDANATARLGVIAQDGSPSAQADQVGRDLGTAAGLLVDAAKARPQDAEALVTISSDLVAYGALLRAADARDDTTAARYLAQADRSLDERLLPALTQLQDDLQRQADAESLTGWSWIVPTVFVLVLGGLVAVSWVVAQRSRRVLNLGLVGAILAAVVVVWIAADAQSAAAAAGTTSAGTNFTKVASLSDAKNRISATRRLQATGTQQRAWSDARTEGVKSGIDGARSASLSSTAKTQLTAYASAATDVSALLTARDWAGAEKALASEADTGVSATAKAFADTVSNARAEAVSKAATTPGQVRGQLSLQFWAIVAAALGGAFLAVAGIQQRVREYR